jgi:23S rRNA pseudouridine2604 synthase
MTMDEQAMGKRLNKYIADSGYCSRREADRLIQEGRVRLGERVGALGDRVEPGMSVTVDGKSLTGEGEKVYILLNKPRGIVCTADPREPMNVVDYLGYPVRVFPVGRLDKDSEGLLLMSNDGELVNRLTHPRYEHRKIYLVKVAGRWSAEKLEILRSPLTLDDGYTIRPVPVEVVREWENNTRLLKFTLGEGRKRQIRKMCSAAHLVVLSLKRVAVGGFELPRDLEPGQWRDLTDGEIASLAGGDGTDQDARV